MKKKKGRFLKDRTNITARISGDFCVAANLLQCAAQGGRDEAAWAPGELQQQRKKYYIKFSVCFYRLATVNFSLAI